MTPEERAQLLLDKYPGLGNFFVVIIRQDIAAAIREALGEQSEEIQASGWLSPTEAVGMRAEVERLNKDNLRLRMHGTVVDEEGEFWWHRCERAEAEVERLRAALAQYADKDNWATLTDTDETYDWWQEVGHGYELAREALGLGTWEQQREVYESERRCGDDQCEAVCH